MGKSYLVLNVSARVLPWPGFPLVRQKLKENRVSLFIASLFACDASLWALASKQYGHRRGVQISARFRRRQRQK